MDNFIWGVGLVSLAALGGLTGVWLGLVVCHMRNAWLFTRLVIKYSATDAYRKLNAWHRWQIAFREWCEYVLDAPDAMIVNGTRIEYPNRVEPYFPA